MLSFTFSRLAILLFTVFTRFTLSAAFPVNGSYVHLPGEDHHTRDLAPRAAQAAPHWVIYSDKWVSGQTTVPATASQLKGYNVFILSFLLTAGAWDQAYTWASLTADQRATIKSQYAAAGIKLLVSAFGATDAPTTAGLDPVALGNSMANWVKTYNLDGIDVDYEDFNAINAQNGKAEQWLITFTKTLRAALPANQYIITHAPVAPWFSPNKYASGAYLKVNSEVGSLIDWYNVQFYNQGTTEYTTCDGLFTASSSAWPKSSVFEIAASGVALNKIVVGKPGNSADASNGYIAPSTLASCLSSAKAKGWSGGVMVWQYPDATASWIQTVRSSSWAV